MPWSATNTLTRHSKQPHKCIYLLQEKKSKALLLCIKKLLSFLVALICSRIIIWMECIYWESAATSKQQAHLFKHISQLIFYILQLTLSLHNIFGTIYWCIGQYIYHISKQRGSRYRNRSTKNKVFSWQQRYLLLLQWLFIASRVPDGRVQEATSESRQNLLWLMKYS